MRILVVSDTHGSEGELRRALLAQPGAEVVFHLGDGEEEARRMQHLFPKKMFYHARGNGDWASSSPMEGLVQIEAVPIFYAHGHAYHVKSGEGVLIARAREQEAKVVLYGHTHKAVASFEDGLYIMNPGALSGWEPSYGTIDITPQGIVTNIVSTAEKPPDSMLWTM